MSVRRRNYNNGQWYKHWSKRYQKNWRSFRFEKEMSECLHLNFVICALDRRVDSATFFAAVVVFGAVVAVAAHWYKGYWSKFRAKKKSKSCVFKIETLRFRTASEKKPVINVQK